MHKKWIWVTFQKSGFHYYPDALLNPELHDVKYLGLKHRHLFKFKVWIEVFHDNRELEFHQVLNYCESLFVDGSIQADGKSLEMISDELYGILKEKYPSRSINIEISEDGECGSFIEYPAIDWNKYN